MIILGLTFILYVLKLSAGTGFYNNCTGLPYGSLKEPTRLCMQLTVVPTYTCHSTVAVCMLTLVPSSSANLLHPILHNLKNRLRKPSKRIKGQLNGLKNVKDTAILTGKVKKLKKGACQNMLMPKKHQAPWTMTCYAKLLPDPFQAKWQSQVMFASISKKTLAFKVRIPLPQPPRRLDRLDGVKKTWNTIYLQNTHKSPLQKRTRSYDTELRPLSALSWWTRVET